MTDRTDAATQPPETRDMSDAAVRERIVRLAFDGDEGRFARFVEVLREVVTPDATVILRGSAVTGERWEDGAPFDADGPRTSDVDLTFVGGDMLRLFERFYIPALHSVPLSEEHPDAAPSLVPLRHTLCALAGRPVNIQATSDLVQYARDVVFNQPYYVLLAGSDAS
ncbi:MAG TPA: hypothetical protein VF048_03680 [Gemmatimonadaceae bacterium]|jgi:hypothetical protein